MYSVKNQVFEFLSQRQKSSLLSYMKSFVKKHSNLNIDDILDEFIQEEQYYIEINSSRFEFLSEYFSNEEFIRDFKLYTKEIFFELEQKEKLKPIIEKQKLIQKEQRKKANDYKMSKLKPTKKQLFYYEKVAKAHNTPLKPTENASRLDVRNWIMEIIDPKEEFEDE